MNILGVSQSMFMVGKFDSGLTRLYLVIGYANEGSEEWCAIVVDTYAPGIAQYADEHFEMLASDYGESGRSRLENRMLYGDLRDFEERPLRTHKTEATKAPPKRGRRQV